MRIRKLGACRGDGRIFIKVALGKRDGGLLSNVNVRGVVSGNIVPVDAYPAGVVYGKPTEEWVLVVPSLGAKCIHLNLSDAEDVQDCTATIVYYEALKWESRFNYRARKDLCAQIRDYQRSFIEGHYQVRIMRYLESNEGIVWRACIEWSGDTGERLPEISFLDSLGTPVEYSTHFFEFQENCRTRDGRAFKRLFLSVEMPAETRFFIMTAADPLGEIRRGFCSMDGSTYEGMKYDSWRYMKDARADDAAYREWFELNKAKTGELAAQRLNWSSFERRPMFSIVVPCYCSNAEYLRAMVDSVLNQSYPQWELIMLDASPTQSTVSDVVAAAQDDRVRYVGLEGNAGIVGNTNVGIGVSKGDIVAFLDHDDLLEPDALFEYARAANSNPQAQVFFCDEDMFSKAGEWGQPVFKSALNVDLLYSHNCITHFLAVDAALLSEIGVSPDDVAGAQDYDLTLRALAAHAQFCHVPRMLYHWRMHEGSTSGDNAGSKPYAIEAGRLALQRHFDSLGVAGAVEETRHPFVYRMCYELPQPHPLVSIVIPSKDQADLLEACVTSIVEKSTYDNYEIVVVENNSTNPQTPMRYKALVERSGGRVRVVHWNEGFNYSRIVNFGVSCAKGEYILLLNNDTEVISPGFIEEMMGYLRRADVGVVGAKLYFRDGLTQHVGMLIGPHGAVAHVSQDFPSKREGYLAKAARPGNFSAVTGACQMVRKSMYERVGGYDERFAVGFNDVDFCLRVQELGLRVVFTPYAELYHYEFVSRGREEADPAKQERWKTEQALFMQTWPRYFTEGDPYSNPNLDKNGLYYDL